MCLGQEGLVRRSARVRLAMACHNGRHVFTEGRLDDIFAERTHTQRSAVAVLKQESDHRHTGPAGIWALALARREHAGAAQLHEGLAPLHQLGYAKQRPRP